MVINYFKKPFFLASIICCFVFYSGIFNISSKNKIQCLLSKNNIVQLTGIIQNSPVKLTSGKYYSCKLLVSDIKDKFNNFSTATGIIETFIPSEIVEIYYPGKLYSQAKKNGCYFYEAGGIYTFKGSFHNDVFYSTNCIYNMWPDNFYGKVDFFRGLCRLQFKRLMFSWGSAGGLLLALLSGSKEYTDTSVSENFRNAGLSHILALSGMHLSLFSSIAIFVGDKIGRKRITYLIRIISLILFVWFAGFSPSLLRAFICSCLSLIWVMNGKKDPDLILILCFSFLLQCIIAPDHIYNLGFILSYGALAGILLFNKFFYKQIVKIFPGYFAASLSASTSAQIFTVPVSLIKFGSFSPIGIAATTVVSPVITIFIYLGLFLILISLIFPVLQTPSGIFINLLYTVIKFLVNFFSKFPKWSIN